MAPNDDSKSDVAKPAGMNKWLWIALALLLWTALFAWITTLFWNRSNDLDRYFSWRIGESIAYKDDTKAVFQNWGGKEVSFDYRWTNGKKATISFRLGQVEKKRKCVLTVTGISVGSQEIAVSLNDHALGKLTFPGPEVSRSLVFDSDTLTIKALNILTLDIPNARQPGNGDTRFLGLALKSFIIDYVDK